MAEQSNVAKGVSPQEEGLSCEATQAGGVMQAMVGGAVQRRGGGEVEARFAISLVEALRVSTPRPPNQTSAAQEGAPCVLGAESAEIALEAALVWIREQIRRHGGMARF